MKFIHVADPNLGQPAGPGESASLAKQRSEAFRSVIADCSSRRADLLLIAGNLFCSQPSPAMLQEVNSWFAMLAETRVVIIAGENDWFGPNSPYHDFRWSRNTVVLSPDMVECVRFPEIETEVYGRSYDRPEIPEPLYDRAKPMDNDAFHILLARGGDPTHSPIHTDALKRAGFDYVALGYMPFYGPLIKGKAIYSGTLNPPAGQEEGPHGYVFGQVKSSRLKLEYVTVWEEEADEEMTEAEEPEYQQAPPRQTITRMGSLIGGRTVSRSDSRAGCRSESSDLDLATLRKQYAGTMIEKYIESFDGHGRSQTEEKALRYGLAALLNSLREEYR